MEQTFTPAQVVRIVGISRRGLDLKIKKGQISTRSIDGRKKISLSELMRVFPETTADMIEKGSQLPTKGNENSQNSDVNPIISELTSKISKLEGEKTMAEMKIQFLEEKIRFLEANLKLLTEERGKTLDMMALLISQNGQKRLEEKKVKDTTNQERDSKGRFSKKERPRAVQSSLIENTGDHLEKFF